MRLVARAALGFACFATALGASACGNRFRPAQSHDVASAGDPNLTYARVLDALRGARYGVVAQNTAAHFVRVRSHLDEHVAERATFITLQVDGSAVHLSASGYLVHSDGTIHRNLNSELGALQKLLSQNLAAARAAPPVAGNIPPAVSAAPPASVGPVSAPTAALPLAWSEPAYDPAVWGHGNFTCLAVKLPAEEQSQLSLKLSNGEKADVLLSLAYAPELCRSPGQCKLPSGCPALGIGDPERVSRLAGRLSKRDIGSQATLFFKGKPVAVIDLSKHGSIAQAMTEIKH